MKQIMKFLTTCAITGIINLGLFALFLRTPLFSDVYIYYYRILSIVAVITGITAIVLSGIALLCANGRIKAFRLSAVEVFSTTLICALAMITILTVASLPIDRSYTIYSLAEMAENPSKIYSQQEVEDAFIEGYINNMQATKRRLEEQISIGNIEAVDGGYRITEGGKRQIEIFKLYEMIFPVSDKRMLYPNLEE